MPNIAITLQNNTDEPQVIELFQSKSKNSQAGKRFTFTTPYHASYPSGEYFRIKADDINNELTLSSNYTRQQVIDWLNTTNTGSWTINSSIANNIFICFSAFNNLQELEIAGYIFWLLESGGHRLLESGGMLKMEQSS